MEDRETARMRKYGESKTTRIMMANVPHVTSGLGLRKFQADGFLLTRMYIDANVAGWSHYVRRRRARMLCRLSQWLSWSCLQSGISFRPVFHLTASSVFSLAV